MKDKILTALRSQGSKVLYVKGVFILDTGEHLTRQQAMKITGLTANTRLSPKRQLYGDFAWLAAINGARP